MIELLSRFFIKDRHNTDDPHVREAYGMLCSVVAIVFNLLLSAAKFLIGSMAGSVAITADALNNLTDAGSSLLVLVGFKFAGKKPDPDHPFGHGRIEYVMGLVVAAIILVAGVEALRGAIEGIFHPEPVLFSWITVLVLVLSILFKLYLAFMYKHTGRRIGSAVLEMAGKDSLNDTVSTSLALVCMLLFRFTGVNLDAWAGLAVAALILKTAYEGGRDTLSQLMGEKATPETVERIRELVLAHDEFMDIHDLIVHDYGPGRFHVSLHAEVDGEGDIYALHEATDRVMLELDHKLGCISVIHMDPVDTKNPELGVKREAVKALLNELDPALSMHDFRIVPGPTRTNLIFDVLVPFKFRLSDEELLHAIRAAVSEKYPDCFCVIQIDKAFS